MVSRIALHSLRRTPIGASFRGWPPASPPDGRLPARILFPSPVLPRDKRGRLEAKAYDSRRVDAATVHSLADGYSRTLLELIREALTEDEMDSGSDEMELVDLS